MKKIIVINGNGRSGKDTLVNYVSKITKGWHIINVTSISIVMKAAEILGWKGKKTEKDRKFLSELKSLSTWYNNQPLDYCVFSIEKAPEDSIIFIHIREPEEIQNLYEELYRRKIMCEWKTVLIERFEKEYGNLSDDSVKDFSYDFYIKNDGTIEDLQKKTEDLLDKLGVEYESGDTETSNRRDRE